MLIIIHHIHTILITIRLLLANAHRRRKWTNYRLLFTGFLSIRLTRFQHHFSAKPIKMWVIRKVSDHEFCPLSAHISLLGSSLVRRLGRKPNQVSDVLENRSHGVVFETSIFSFVGLCNFKDLNQYMYIDILYSTFST